jgi:hypothetical protein
MPAFPTSPADNEFYPLIPTGGPRWQYDADLEVWNILTGSPVVFTAASINLERVDNTNDLEKPLSTAAIAALANKADLVSGKLDPSQIPNLGIVNYLGMPPNQVAMLALRGQSGDWCIRVDTNSQWIIVANDGSSLSDWVNIPTGIGSTSAVTSVNGSIGDVVLTTSDIAEGSELYFTNSRAQAAVSWGTLAGIPSWLTGTTVYAQGLLAAVDAAAARTTLALGAAATLNVGTSTGTVAAGDDSRFTDARTPLAHTHGNITNVGAIGSTANLPVITTASGVLTTGTFGSTANTFCQGNDSRLSDARTPTAHNQAWSTITATPTTLL